MKAATSRRTPKTDDALELVSQQPAKTTTVFTESIVVRKKSNKLSQILERFSPKAAKATGTSMSFILTPSVIVVWGFTGPLFHFSDTWQLVVLERGDLLLFFLPLFPRQGCNRFQAFS